MNAEALKSLIDSNDVARLKISSVTMADFASYLMRYGYNSLKGRPQNTLNVLFRLLVESARKREIFHERLLIYAIVLSQDHIALGVLMRRGYDVNLVCSCGQELVSPLSLAVTYHQDADLVGFLLDNHADCNIRLANALSPWHMASQHGLVDVIQLFLQKGCLRQMIDGHCWGALHHCAYNGQLKALEFLASQGMSLNRPACPEDPTTPFDLALKNGHVSICKFLIESGVTCTSAQFDLICEMGLESLVEVCITHGAEVNRQGAEPPLYKACKAGHVGVVKILLDHGANRYEPILYPPFVVAVDHGHTDVALTLLEEFDVNREIPLVGSALNAAAVQLNYKVITKLLESGADTNRVDRYERTALMALFVGAMHSQNEKIQDENRFLKLVTLFLEHGADLTKKSYSGYSALHYAAITRQASAMRLLLQWSAAINDVATYDAMTPLHMACNRYWDLDNRGVSLACDTKTIMVLLERGANVNAKDALGNTPLHTLIASYATDKGFFNLIEPVTQLLRFGANVHLVDSHNRTALDILRSQTGMYPSVAYKEVRRSLEQLLMPKPMLSASKAPVFANQQVFNSWMQAYPEQSRLHESVKEAIGRLLEQENGLEIEEFINDFPLLEQRELEFTKLKEGDTIQQEILTNKLLELQRQDLRFLQKDSDQPVPGGNIEELISRLPHVSKQISQRALLQVSAASRSTPFSGLVETVSGWFSGFKNSLFCQGTRVNDVPAYVCRAESGQAIVFFKENVLRPVHEDTYSPRMCRQISFFGRQSLFCEGENTTFVYTPRPQIAPFSLLDAHLLLGMVAIHAFSQLKQWFQGSYEAESEQASRDEVQKKTRFLTQTLEKLAPLVATSSESWAKYGLEDYQSDIEAIAAKAHVSKQELCTLTQNIRYFAQSCKKLLQEKPPFKPLEQVSSFYPNSIQPLPVFY